MAPKYFFLVLFEWVTEGFEYYELHLEVCVHVYIFIRVGYSQESLSHTVIWKEDKGKGELKISGIWVFKRE